MCDVKYINLYKAANINIEIGFSGGERFEQQNSDLLLRRERGTRLHRRVAQAQSGREPSRQRRLLVPALGGDMRQPADRRVSSRARRRHKHDRQRDALGYSLECRVRTRGHSRLSARAQRRPRDR